MHLLNLLFFCRPLVGYGGGSSDDDDGDENDVAHALSTSREGSAAADREAMTEERRSKLREIEVRALRPVVHRGCK